MGSHKHLVHCNDIIGNGSKLFFLWSKLETSCAPGVAEAIRHLNAQGDLAQGGEGQSPGPGSLEKRWHEGQAVPLRRVPGEWGCREAGVGSVALGVLRAAVLIGDRAAMGGGSWDGFRSTGELSSGVLPQVCRDADPLRL